MKKIGLTLSVILGVVALALPAGAAAGEWIWSGGLWPGSGGRDGNCIWYPNQSSCAGWNYWAFTSGSALSGPYVKYLTGYENNVRIRGIWIYDGDAGSIYAAALDMQGYNKAVATYWEGTGTYYWSYART